MKRSIWFVTISVLFFLSKFGFAYTNGTGAVTPSGLIITVTEAFLIRDDNSRVQVLSGNYNVEFTRAGASFAAIKLDNITVPAGKYIGVSLTFNEAYQVKLNGDKYIGQNKVLNGGDALYTTAAGDGRAAGSVTKTAGTAVYVNNIKNVGYSGCQGTCSSQTYFKAPFCVATDASQCGGAIFVGGDGTTTPNLNILMDIYQAISVDAQDLSIAKGPSYPYGTIGDPGAAIHLTAFNGTTGADNISLLFSADKTIQFAASYSNGTVAIGPGGGTTPGVTTTSGPTQNSYGPTMIMSFNSTTGKLQMPQGGCSSPTCTSSGLMTLDNVLQALNSAANYSCSADTTGALGYTYTGGSCSGSTNGAFTVSRIVDPKNIFGICASGTCAITSAPTSADGYL